MKTETNIQRRLFFGVMTAAILGGINLASDCTIPVVIGWALIGLGVGSVGDYVLEWLS